jgi:cell fate (sporulation/competence/biofilm development) regulator YmcA (YheA/YmcA/DUF963 family)
VISAKEFLMQVELCDIHISNKLDERQRLKDMVLKITSTWKDDVTSGGSGNQDKMGDAVSKIVDLEMEINRAVDAYVDKKKEVNAVLERIKDPDQVSVLYKKYFQYMTWEQIACDMHMTYRNVCYIHGKALQVVEGLLKGGADNG